MKTYLLLFALLGFTPLTGCSADDLAGPDAAIDGPAILAQAPHDEAARTSRPPSLVGAWRASDRLGSITLFLDEPNTQPPSGAVQTFSGKGVISGLLEAPFAVLVEGKYEGHIVAFVLTDTRGKFIAKAEGKIDTDFSLIKAVLINEAGQQRDLMFERF
jgi:hypothetical protein